MVDKPNLVRCDRQTLANDTRHLFTDFASMIRRLSIHCSDILTAPISTTDAVFVNLSHTVYSPLPCANF